MGGDEQAKATAGRADAGQETASVGANAQGHVLIVPEYGLDGWTTSLPAGQFSSADITALYADHGTHEQFHAEFKTDLDLTRLPTGKFDIHYLVCQLAAVAMNILRLIGLIGLIGQRGLLGSDAPLRHAAQRRRLKTVIQESIDRAGRLISTGRKLILGLGANDRSAKAFARPHGELFVASTCSCPITLALLGCLSLTAGKGLPALAARQRPGHHSARRMLVQPIEL